jgi:hypothetical protein
MDCVENHRRHRFGVRNQGEMRSAVELGDGGVARVAMARSDVGVMIWPLDYTPNECRTVMRDNGPQLSIRQPV